MSDQNANEDELLQVALKPNGYPPVETIRAPFVYPVDENRLPGNFSEDEVQLHRELVIVLKSILEKELFYWTHVALELPPTVFKEKIPQQVADVFMQNTYNELHDVAFENGIQKRLSVDQLNELYRTGKFSVASKAFPEIKHVWQVSGIIAKGTETIKKSLLDWYAFSLRQLTVEVPARLYGGLEFSVTKGLEQIATGFRDAVHSLIGLPTKKREYDDYQVNNIIDRQRVKYILKNATPSDLYHLNPTYLLVPLTESEKSEFGDGEKSSFTVDLRYLNSPRSAISKQINNEITRIYTAVSNKWEVERVGFVASLRKELKKFGRDSDDSPNLHEIIAQKCAEEKIKRFYDAISTSEKLQSLQPGISTTVINLFKALRIVRMVEDKYDRELFRYVDQVSARLKRDHPIRSRISYWFDKKLQEQLEIWKKEHEWDREKEIIEAFRAEKLQQELFLFTRDFAFRKTLMEPMRTKLTKILEPAATFVRHRHIWNPKNWHVKKQVVPQLEKDGNRPHFYYYAIKYNTFTSTTWYPFWRILNFFYFTITNWSNGVFYFGWWVTQGPLSLRALLSRHPYYASKRVDSQTGKIVDDPDSKIKPLIVGLADLWKSIRESRNRFEREPETGLIGKSITRIFNVIWNYGVKGVLGSTIFLTITPILTLINTIICLLLICLSVGWAPAIGIIRWLFTVLIYDADLPNQTKSYLPLIQALVWRVLFRGIFCILCSLVFGLVIHPTVATASWAFSSINAGIQWIYYSLIHFTLIRPIAKIPAHNGFLARRIQGPGIASTVFLQVTPQEAMTYVRAHLESEELTIWEQRMLRIISFPRTLLSKMKVHDTLRMLGLTLDTNDPLFHPIHNSYNRMLTSLRSKLGKRRERIPVCKNKRLLRQSSTDLDHTKQLARKLISKFVQERILTQLTDEQVTKWWAKYNCQKDDFENLTIAILQSVFSPEFLKPLEEHDKYVSLCLKHSDLPGLMDILEGADPLLEVDDVSVTPSTPTKTTNIIEVNPFHLSPTSPRQQALWPLNVEWYTLVNSPVPGEQEVDDSVAIKNKNDKDSNDACLDCNF